MIPESYYLLQTTKVVVSSGTGRRLLKVGWRISLPVLLFSLISISGMSQVSSSNEAVEAWVQNGSWKKGLQEKPHSSVDMKKLYTQYHLHKKWWEKAFAFMKRKDLSTLPPGKYPIDGEDVFATISDYVPKDTGEIKWEAHRKYADIQFLTTGEEKIGIAAADSLEEIVPYNADKDAANYAGPGKYYIARPGTFFIFFPGTAHRPNLKTNDRDTAIVRKVVIKMRIP